MLSILHAYMKSSLVLMAMSLAYGITHTCPHPTHTPPYLHPYPPITLNTFLAVESFSADSSPQRSSICVQSAYLSLEVVMMAQSSLSISCHSCMWLQHSSADNSHIPPWILDILQHLPSLELQCNVRKCPFHYSSPHISNHQVCPRHDNHPLVYFHSRHYNLL